MLLIEFFILGMIGSWIIAQFSCVGPRRCPMSQARAKSILQQGGKFLSGISYNPMPYGRQGVAWSF